MKRVKYLYHILSLLLVMLCLNGCDDKKDIDKVKEYLELEASETKIALDADNLTDDILTFTWTKAREVPDDNIVSYTTKLDVVGNNFGSSTAILAYEDESVFSKSFTSEQLQNWANEKWALPVNKPFTLEFRIIVQWEGGSQFEAPEVRTVMVDVQPIKYIVFDADKVFLDGTATTGVGKVEMSKTLENDNQYACLLNLGVGQLKIPVEFEGATNYICPIDGEGTLLDGEAEDVVIRENPAAWDITVAGEYRVVINMDKTTITIYSPAKALEPISVDWTLAGEMQTTIVDKLWRYGSDGWSWKAIDFVPSLADPQVLVYSGSAINGRTKFGVAPQNASYVYTGNSTGADTPVTIGTAQTLFGGNGGTAGGANERNSYFSIPAGTNFIIMDIRNMMILFEKR